MISIIIFTDGVREGVDIIVRKEDLQAFKDMVARACNVWPDAPAAIKEFHDVLIHGQALHDYYSEPKLKRREELAPSENMKLDSWASENSEAGE